MPFEIALCAAKLVAGIAPALLALDKGEVGEVCAKALEAALKGGEAVKALHEPQHRVLSAALAKAAKQVETLYAESLRRDHSAGFRAEIEVALANLAEVTSRCLPSSEALAKLKHDPTRVADAVVEAALAIRMDIFANPHGEARRLLTTWVATTYRCLRDEPKFMETLAGVNWGLALTRLDEIKEQNVATQLQIDASFSRQERVMEALRQDIGANISASIGTAASESDRIKSRAINTSQNHIDSGEYDSAELVLDCELRKSEIEYKNYTIQLLYQKYIAQHKSKKSVAAKRTIVEVLKIDPDTTWALDLIKES